MMSTPSPYRNFVNRRCVPDLQHGKVVTLPTTASAVCHAVTPERHTTAKG